MDILFFHLQVHLETLYYKFAPYHKNAGVNIRNGYRDPEKYTKGVYLYNNPQTIPIPKAKALVDPSKVGAASPSHNSHINNQYSNGCLSTYPNKSVLYRVSHFITHFRNHHYSTLYSIRYCNIFLTQLINYVLKTILAQRSSCIMGSFGRTGIKRH